MSRAFCIPGVIFLFCALALSFLASISLPFIPALDIVRTTFRNDVAQNSQALSQIRFGIWAPCYYDSHDARTCLKTSHAYNVTITNESKTEVAVVQASWTRGLVVQPLATAVTFIAFIFALSTHSVMTLLASLFSFLAALLTLIAFAIDIALFALVKHEMERFGGGTANSTTGAGFWLSFASLILLLLGGCTVCFGHRNASAGRRNASAGPKRPWFRRFAKN